MDPSLYGIRPCSTCRLAERTRVPTVAVLGRATRWVRRDPLLRPRHAAEQFLWTPSNTPLDDEEVRLAAALEPYGRPKRRDAAGVDGQIPARCRFLHE